jgi:hypothetical protein
MNTWMATAFSVETVKSTLRKLAALAHSKHLMTNSVPIPWFLYRATNPIPSSATKGDVSQSSGKERHHPTT